jgi:hypothetical protein
MFVRFRKGGRRLQVSLVECRRVNGGVQHEHVASFGSVPVPPSIHERLVFWQRLHERLGRLQNRIDAAAQAKIMAEVHTRVPMVSVNEQRAQQLQNVEADERLWSSLHGLHDALAADQRGLAATTERAIADNETAMAQASTKAAAARDRIARIKAGEEVPGGLGKSVTLKDWIKTLGLSKHDLRRMDLSRAVDMLGPEAWAEFERELRRSDYGVNRAGNAAARKVLRKWHAERPDVWAERLAGFEPLAD